MKMNSRRLGSGLLSLLIATSPLASFAQEASMDIASMDVAAVGLSKSQLRNGQRLFISADTLNVRASNSTTAPVIGKLSLNDEIEIYNVLNEATPLVQIRIINSASLNASGNELYISKDYLSPNKTQSVSSTSSSKYFVVQNIATETTRVYERCTTSPDCPHKLVMESDTVVGRPEDATSKDPIADKTWLGHTRIATWVKFYQDGLGHYPHWYRAGQSISDIPKPMSETDRNFFLTTRASWAKGWRVKDANGKSTVHGAFGWYAAKMNPEMNSQWMHGTFGWGSDGDAAIQFTRGKIVNFFSNPGSAGCTRLENRAIAYLRHLLPAGTDIYRVYALETIRSDADVRVRYPSQAPLPWNYVLTTTEAQKSGGLTADRNTLIMRGLPTSGPTVIEAGNYLVDQYPTVRGFNGGLKSSGNSGDRYGVDKKNFRGYYLVDEGRFINYKHPNSNQVKVSGLQEFRTSVPAYLQTSGYYLTPAK